MNLLAIHPCQGKQKSMRISRALQKTQLVVKTQQTRPKKYT